ncbi:MAG: hypothetical protein IT291_10985 [Deltaproteobacteria bacterium]|nr:hypothetical protein [Deltaproteobacteria bacterium]
MTEQASKTAVRREISAGCIDTFATSLAQNSAFLSINQLRQLVQARELGSNAKFIQETAEYSFCKTPIDIESLSILEAELVNQEIALCRGPAGTVCSLAQRATLDKNSLCWHARRVLLALPEMAFFVDVPRYVLAWADEIENIYSGEHNFSFSPQKIDDPSATASVIASRQEARDKLDYLNTFADYCLGKYSRRRSAPPYLEPGLNFILKLLATSRKFEQNSSLNYICLPISKKEFIQKTKTILLEGAGCRPQKS